MMSDFETMPVGEVVIPEPPVPEPKGTWFAQSVNGVVDLVGDETVGLQYERTEPNVRVRKDPDRVVQIGWLWDEETETFSKPPDIVVPPTPEEMIQELKTLLDDVILNPYKDPEIAEIKTVLDDIILNGGAI